MQPEADRNRASPTESAVWKRRQREHSGADWLNSPGICGRRNLSVCTFVISAGAIPYIRQVGQYVVRVKHKSGKAILRRRQRAAADSFPIVGGTADKIVIRPGIRRRIPGRFSMANYRIIHRNPRIYRNTPKIQRNAQTLSERSGEYEQHLQRRHVGPDNGG